MSSPPQFYLLLRGFLGNQFIMLCVAYFMLLMWCMLIYSILHVKFLDGWRWYGLEAKVLSDDSSPSQNLLSHCYFQQLVLHPCSLERKFFTSLEVRSWRWMSTSWERLLRTKILKYNLPDINSRRQEMNCNVHWREERN